MKTTLSVYIAGPMTGYPEHNFPAFRAAAERWRTGGWEVINPAELDDESLGHDALSAIPWEDFLARDLPLVLKADAIAMLPGWQASRGATLEHMVAQYCGKRVFDANWPAKHPITDHGYIEGMNVCCDAPDYMHLPLWSHVA